MANLFVFAIGGSGSRVIKALTMLLASGVKMNNIDAIIPIIIDPDTANADLSRTVELIRLYHKLRSKSEQQENTFFNANIRSLDEMGTDGQSTSTYRFEVDGVKDSKFAHFIDYNSLDINNRALASLLFSEANLDTFMDVGFKGNPNIGSVVLNKMKYSDFFIKFAAAFRPNDRIFIISSIFGGTGAAGFPLLLKNIRDADEKVSNHVLLQNAKIGAVTLLPYFDIEKDEAATTINSDTFITKSKAALSYYSRTVTNDGAINALYYIGDYVNNPQKGSDGGATQKNKAHFIELIAALSLIDFMEYSDDDLLVERGRAIMPKFLEFGLKNETNQISFKDLGDETYGQIARPLTQYSLSSSFIKHHYNEFKDKPWAQEGKKQLTENSIDKNFLQNLKKFNEAFDEWLLEMETSQIKCKPFERSKRSEDLLDMVEGYKEQKSFLSLSDKGVKFLVSKMNGVHRKLDHLTAEQKLLAVFSLATDHTITDRIKL